LARSGAIADIGCWHKSAGGHGGGGSLGANKPFANDY